MEPIYNCYREEYKSPFGAVKAGQAVRFAILVPGEYKCTAPVLFLQREGEAPTRHPMAPGGAGEGGAARFTADILPQQPGLYFYWFDLWVDYQKLYMRPDGAAYVSREEGPTWPLLVYDGGFATPCEVQGGVMYQIFPDRFFEGDDERPTAYNERVYRPDKQNPPYFWEGQQGHAGLTQDYFGGDFAGIQKRLPYLSSLGVTCIYLNPIFEAHSNHRYNTANYLQADPYLGTNEDFARLCAAAAKLGIRIILDGVFSHTGSDSLYFNKEGRYPTVGAWQGPQSPYRSWYRFLPDGRYESWWGFETLPTCNKQDEGFRRFITGEGGVIDTWMGLGAAGFRLDVADELPDDFIAEIRCAVKRHGEDKLLIGEVWEDAALKVAYGVRRQYFWGDELDGVMNYPFRTAILQYLKTFDAVDFRAAVLSICEHYPQQALACCTTHISTHDTLRAITALVGDDAEGKDRNWQSMQRLSPEQYHMGILRMRLAFVLQFTLPGIPCVYYGDEIAMQGYADPFNRAYYDWHSGEDRLIPLVMSLSHLRRACSAFAGGSLHIDIAKNGLLVYRREGQGAAAAIAVNCSGFPAHVNLLGQDVTVPMMDFAIRAQTEEGKPDIALP